MNAKIAGRQIGNKWRDILMRELQNDPEWGQLDLSTNGKILSYDGSKLSKTIIVRYSKLHYGNRWWYDIPISYWKNWDDDTFLAFLFPDGNECSFVILNPQEARALLSKITPSDSRDAKIVHVHKEPESTRGPYIRQWDDFPLKSRLKGLPALQDEKV